MEKHCAIGRPDPAKVYPLLASLSWQLLGALPKAGSGKHKGSLCKTFSGKKKKKKKPNSDAQGSDSWPVGLVESRSAKPVHTEG